jgi:ribosomal protein S18 acetylase RimI-like enzyme
MNIRTADIQDIPAMHWPPQWARPTELQVRAGEVYVARRDDEKICGILIFNRTFYDRPFIAMLIVNESSRRAGVGNALLRHVESMCSGQKLFTSTSLCNTPMQRLLAKMGYQLTGVIENIGPQAELVYFKICKGI